MGDAIDNVPGVPGIGEKTAQKLVADFGTVEQLLDRVQEIKGKRRQVLQEHADQALLSKRLVTIETEVPLELEIEALKRGPADDRVLTGLFSELEFNALGKRLFGDDFEAGVQRMDGRRRGAPRGPLQSPTWTTTTGPSRTPPAAPP